ncbi:hypothetical protein ACWCW7_33745 [Nocardia tengchongensis]
MLLALVAILLCGHGISSAEPTTPTPAPPTLTTPTPPATVAPPTTGGVPAPVTPRQRPYSSTSGGSVDDSDCGVSDISACVAGAIDGFFARLVDSAFNPILELLSKHLLTTPEPSQLPRLRELWSSSWQLMVAVYGLVVMAVGVLLMFHETLQTRWGWRELLPRLAMGFIAGAMSMLLSTKVIQFANGLTIAVAGDGVDPDSAAAAFRSLMKVGAGSVDSLFATLLVLALIVVLTLLLITWVIRLVITVVLVAAAPLAMMCHALPGLDGIARWWWRAFGACLAIQVVQSLVLVVGLRVFLAENWSWFGITPNGLPSIIVADAMALLLLKIPFWLLSVLKIGNGRGMVASLARSFVMYKAMGALKGGGKSAAAPPKPKATGGPKPPPDPYAKVRATRSGQLMLPLQGVRQVPQPPPPAPQPRIPHAASIPVAAPQGQQLMLPLPQFHGGVNLGATPVLGRNGQYQLPIPVQRVAKPAAPPTPPVARPLPGTRSPQPKQLAFDYGAAAPTPPDPYAKVRPTRSGQYPLPIEVRRTSPPRTATPPPTRTATPPPPRVSGSTGRQLHLPLPDLPVRRRSPGKGSK